MIAAPAAPVAGRSSQWGRGRPLTLTPVEEGSAARRPFFQKGRRFEPHTWFLVVLAHARENPVPVGEARPGARSRLRRREALPGLSHCRYPCG